MKNVTRGTDKLRSAERYFAADLVCMNLCWYDSAVYAREGHLEQCGWIEKPWIDDILLSSVLSHIFGKWQKLIKIRLKDSFFSATWKRLLLLLLTTFI